MISKAQKMQHLKGKLRGEAERIVQHLSVSAENYDTCWELLNHRYNNLQLLFTKQMQLFLNQPNIQQQNAFEIKRLHDTSQEVVHAIHNLGIDTSSWDPILVHILTNKLDSDTYTSYMETRKKPRELPHFDEFIEFLDGKFTALEPVIKRQQTTTNQHRQARDFPPMPQNDGHNSGKFKRFIAKSYHANTERNCPICKTNHILLYCKTFQNMTPSDKQATMSQLNICGNCLFSHNGKQCTSVKRCKVCNTAHHTSLHDLLRDTTCAPPASSMSAIQEQPDISDNYKQRNSNNHVSGNFNEVLLATVQIKVKAADGTLMQLRCLLDQGSQINLITESAAQQLGLKRYKQNATVSGIGLSAKQSNGTVQLICQSLYGDHEFSTDALVMTNMINNLPNYSFEKKQCSYLSNINLADPDYNISRPIDALLDAGVYADIVMDGILRGPAYAPIAQQTKLGWVLLGNVKTFNCHAVLNNLEDIAQFWEIQEITEQTSNMTPKEEYCEILYNTTTKRLESGRYEVKIPMQPNFEEKLGASKPQTPLQQLCVNDLLGGNSNLEESKTSQKQLIKLLLAEGFNLRKWASNNPSLLEDLTEDKISQNLIDFKNVNNNKTLGVLWNPCTDQFTFDIADLSPHMNDVITKRSLLSDLSKLYDPLGWLSPVTMKGKIIFQQVWKQPLSWDEALPHQIQDEWRTFRAELPMLNNITISRWVGDVQQLHGYCDASEKGYGCVIYAKSTNEHGQTIIKQIAAKTKLVPLTRHVTLPRLELCGMGLLAKLMRKTLDSLNNQTVQVHGWTDSTVALGWLQGDITRWKTFVANRVT